MRSSLDDSLGFVCFIASVGDFGRSTESFLIWVSSWFWHLKQIQGIACGIGSVPKKNDWMNVFSFKHI